MTAIQESENDYMNNKSPKLSGGKSYIICSAVWFQDGKKYAHQPKNIDSGIVVAGRRHHNCYLTMCPDGNFEKVKGIENIQGFITSDDNFLDRKEAGKLALEVGQIEKVTECLFSEDIY